jgi:MFS superfamily sulfate permease-like transporter
VPARLYRKFFVSTNFDRLSPGVSLTLLTSQISRLTTVQVEAKGLLRPLIELSGQLTRIHVPTLVFGAGIFPLLRLLKWWFPRSPGFLVAVIIGTLLSFLFNLESFGVSLVGKIPAVLPTLTLRVPEGIDLDDLALEAFGILVVSFGSGIVTARSFGAKNRYRVDANRELIGFGAANIASGLFGGFPVSGADSRTAINDAVGGRTQVAGLIAAAALTFVLVVLTDVMKYLPVAVLGAVIASAAIDLFRREGTPASWQTSQVEFLFALIAMLGASVLASSGAYSSPSSPPASIYWLAYLARATPCWAASLGVMVSTSCIVNRALRRSPASLSISCKAA